MSDFNIDPIALQILHKYQLPITILQKPRNAKEYSNLEKILDKLIDEVRGNEQHPLALIMQIIGENLEQYDDNILL